MRIHDIYELHIPGSDAFVAAVQRNCAYDISPTEIRRLTTRCVSGVTRTSRAQAQAAEFPPDRGFEPRKFIGCDPTLGLSRSGGMPSRDLRHE